MNLTGIFIHYSEDSLNITLAVIVLLSHSGYIGKDLGRYYGSGRFKIRVRHKSSRISPRQGHNARTKPLWGLEMVPYPRASGDRMLTTYLSDEEEELSTEHVPSRSGLIL